MIGIAVLLLPAAAAASGSYRARPPRPVIVRPDPEKYRAGKEVFKGTAALEDRTAEYELAQRIRLLELQGKLPEEERKKLDLPALAGMLRPEELDALELYARNREQIPADADPVEYRRGMRLFSGEIEVAGRPSALIAIQRQRLEGLQSRLPAVVLRRIDLPALAGKLSLEQLEGLEHYLEVRYRIKGRPAEAAAQSQE
jgi:hypothetical protein